MVDDVNDELRKEVWGYLKDGALIFLATTEGDQPRVRPMRLMRVGDRLFVVSRSFKSKVKQIGKNPKVELCFMVPDIGRNNIRVECVAKIIDDKEVRAIVYNHYGERLKRWYKSPEDPVMALVEFIPTRFEYLKPPPVINAVIIKNTQPPSPSGQNQ
jgi:uncharacterized pyridoxamine 5'-phosphate oxidase family protein